jgi:hypothetical protein
MRAVQLTALIQRLNRQLKAKDQYALYTPRGRGGRGERTYFIVDLRNNTVVADKMTTAKLENMARELGVLKAWEELEQ